jgi:DNA-binding NarL/FixJ family response regulator
LTAQLLEGLKSKQIAAQLGTTCQVIKNKVTLIYDKLGVRSRYDLLKAFLESPPPCESASMNRADPKFSYVTS